MTTAQVACDSCGRTVDVNLETEEVNREERQMGAEIQHDTTGEVTCECGAEIGYSRSYWEYPEDVPNHQEGPSVTGGPLL